MKRIVFISLWLIVLTSCSQDEDVLDEANTADPEPTFVREFPTEPAELPSKSTEPIEVTYFTPSQQEGPYYPVEKPEDQRILAPRSEWDTLSGTDPGWREGGDGTQTAAPQPWPQ